nr:integrase, catalytic region, zinc finger, CCHC-type, peptidase aspartic, catalytic [Tanacetum cinerariifolium]
MSNTNNNMQTQTSNTLHNAIMEAGGKDRPPMLAPDKEVPISEGIDNNIYYTVDACLNACEMWKAFKRLKHGESINVQDLKTKLYWEFGKFTSQDVLTSTTNRMAKHQNEVNEIRAKRIARTANPLELVAQQKPAYDLQNHPTHYTQNSSTRSQQAATRNRGKAIVQPIYDQEPSMVAEDDEMSKDKEIDKLMALISLSGVGYDNQRLGNVARAKETVDDEMSKDKEIDKLMVLISLSFKKIYKPTNNNLRTSSNTSRANQNNSPRIKRGVGYDNQRLGNVVRARDTVGTTMVQKSRIQCYNCKEFGHVARECQKPKRAKDAAYQREKMLLYQELEAHYMYMAQIQEVTPDATDDSEPIFDPEPLHKIYQNDDDDDLANECELLASLIEKLKCEIDDSKNRNKFLETSNKVLVDKLKGEIEDFKNQNKNLESSNNRFKKANNKLSETNALMYKDLKKFLAELDRRNDVDLNAKTSNVNLVCATCGKCVLNEKHDMCVLNSRNYVNSRTKITMVVPVSTREPKRTVKQFVAKPLRKTVASESNHKPRNKSWKLYKHVNKACSWWYPKFTPSGYKWKPKSEIGNVNQNLVEIILFIVESGCSKHMTRNLKLLINFVEKFLGTVKFENDQIAPILGYRDLIQGAITIKRVYYVKRMNHNLFSVGQLCNADLEVAFRKSTCYIRDLKRNDLLTGSRGRDLYSITLQDTTSPNPICLMAKATSSQAWLWLRRLSHLNFDTINLLSKNDIVVGLPKLKFIKDHLCSSCELGKAKRKSFQTKTTPSSKRRLQLLHMDLCGPMRVASINGRKYVLVLLMITPDT